MMVVVIGLDHALVMGMKMTLDVPVIMAVRWFAID